MEKNMKRFMSTYAIDLFNTCCMYTAICSRRATIEQVQQAGVEAQTCRSY